VNLFELGSLPSSGLVVMFIVVSSNSQPHHCIHIVVFDLVVAFVIVVIDLTASLLHLLFSLTSGPCCHACGLVVAFVIVVFELTAFILHFIVVFVALSGSVRFWLIRRR
jgi:hypothetical protein